MKQELFAALSSMNNEIPEKEKPKYSLDELIKLLKTSQGKFKNGK